MNQDLAGRWRAARPQPAGIHLDSAACSRQSDAVIDAVTRHARHEAEVGGYVAAAAAEPALLAGRTAIAALTGMTPGDVVFTTGSNHALDLLLSSWPGPRTVACAPGEYGPNLAIMAAHGFEVRQLPADEFGRLLVIESVAQLQADPPALVHITGVASHRGVAQPMKQLVDLCHTIGIPVVLDAAQALGLLDCAVGADAVYSSSRKWMAGPRGVGFLAVEPDLADRLVRRLPPADWDVPLGALASFERTEANVAARVGFSVAVGEYLAAGPQDVRQQLAYLGKTARALLDGVAGWRTAEPVDEPTAIVTFAPPPGVDPAAVRQWLIEQRGIVTTAAEIARAPFELPTPVLRISPHVDATTTDLEGFATALEEATATTPRT